MFGYVNVVTLQTSERMAANIHSLFIFLLFIQFGETMNDAFYINIEYCFVCMFINNNFIVINLILKL